MTAILQDQPLPARLLPWPKALPSTLSQCLALALLLHVWLVLLLGNTPGGTAQQGLGVWGAINVTLRGPVTAGPATVVLPPAPPAPANALPGDAAVPRWGGAVRSAEPVPAPNPGAARLGEAAPRVAALPDAPAVATPAPGRVLEERVLPPLPPVLASPSGAETAAAEALLNTPALPALPELAAPPALAALADAPPALRRLQATPQASAAASTQPALPRSADWPPMPVLAPAAVPAAGLASARPGAADAGAQVGHDVATPPAAAASALPRLNLELARPRGGELSRHSTSGVLPLLPRPPERDDKLGREIEKAAKTDCRNAHTGLGLLAVIPLAVDAMRKDGGCKW